MRALRWMCLTGMILTLAPLAGCIPTGGGGGSDSDGGAGMGGEAGMGGVAGMGGQAGAGGAAGMGGVAGVGGGEPDGCDQEGQVEQRACGLGDSGLETRACVGGEWSDWGPCEGAAACEDGATEDEACGEMGNGTRSRACVGGQWTAWGPCDDPDRACTDGETEEAPCGLNGRGVQSHACEGGRWGPFDDCVDPDVCVDGAAERQACGLNGRGTQSRACVEGQWGEFAACVDPDVCTDGAIERAPCGLNGRGDGQSACVDGQWSAGACEDPDDCVDGSELESPCGLNDRGVIAEVCVEGAYAAGECVDPDVCVDGDNEPQICGINSRGVEIRGCVEGQWGEFGPCEDPDVCRDGLTEARACGRNGQGLEERLCVEGQWGMWGMCLDGDDCDIGAVEERACGLNGRGVESRSCDGGAWGPYGPCEDPDACVDGAVEERDCPIGAPERRICVDGQYDPWSGCVGGDGATPIAAPGGSIELEGQLDVDDETFTRPNAGCTPRANPDHRFDAFRIVNNTGADQRLNLLAVWGAGDGYLLVYADDFDPAMPIEGCVIGNDDYPNTDRSGLEGVQIAAGQTLTVVATSFGAGADIGPYTITVSTLGAGRPPAPGELAITEFMFNPDVVDDRVGEWFEVLSLSDELLQLGGVVIADSANQHLIEGDVRIEPGGRIVIGLNEDPDRNGGVAIDYRFSGFLLDNPGDELTLLTGAGDVIDGLSYDPLFGWPAEPGRAVQLNGALDPGRVDRSVPNVWCLATAPLPGGDFGTPGAPNTPCE